MDENKSIKVLSGPKPWHELTKEERRALILKHVKKMLNTKKNNKKEG